MDYRTALRLSIMPLPLLILAACAPAEGPERGSGNMTMQLVKTGDVRCLAPSTAETAAAVASTNAARAARGQPPVRGSAALSEAAARHACDMARRGRMTHRGSGGDGPLQRLKAHGYRAAMAAENIAAGPFDLRAVLAAWTGSAGHRANILNPQAREVGIGQALGADGRTRFWAALYAAPR